MAIFSIKRLIFMLIAIVILTIWYQLCYLQGLGYQEDEQKSLKKIGSLSTFDLPPLKWKKVKNFHVYSSYMIDEYGYEILGVSQGEVSCENLKCLIYYIHSEGIFFYEGTLSCESSYVNNSYYRYLNMSCMIEPISSDLKPFTSALIDEFNVEYMIPLYKKFKPSGTKRYCACILPHSYGLDLYSAVLYLSYKQLIGFSDILIYKNQLEDDVLDLIVDSSNSTILKGNFKSISTQVWNFPFFDDSVSNNLLSKDCIYRSVGNMKLIVITPWHHYIIPPKINSTINILGEVNYSNAIIPMKQRKCCLDSSDQEMKNSTVLSLFHKKNCCLTKEVTFLYINPICSLEPAKVLKSPAGLHVEFIGYCANSCNKSFPNRRKLQFYNRIIESKLFKIWEDWEAMF